MTESVGKIIIQAGAEVWPHELKTAEALIRCGFNVEFPPKDKTKGKRSADVFLNGVMYEIKSPESSHLLVVDKNIKKALSQSCCIVFDSRRMKNAKDSQVLHELEKSIVSHRKIKSLIFVDKKRIIHKLK